MSCHWLLNTKTKKTLFIDENHFEIFEIEKSKIGAKDYPWIFTSKPEKKEDKKILNKPKQKPIFALKKGDKIIRADETQIAFFVNQGFERVDDSEVSEVKTEVVTDLKTNLKTVEITEEEIVNFLGGLDPENDALWEEDQTVSQTALDDQFGEGLVKKDRIAQVWDGFSKASLT